MGKTDQIFGVVHSISHYAEGEVVIQLQEADITRKSRVTWQKQQMLAVPTYIGAMTIGGIFSAMKHGQLGS